MKHSVDPALFNRSVAVADNSFLQTPALLLGKAIEFHPDSGTVDVAVDGAISQAGIHRNVRVLSWNAGSQTGESYFPTVDLAEPAAHKDGVFDIALPSGKEDVWCVIGYLNGRANRPVCLGFMQPLESSARSSDVGDELEVHESGVYKLLTKSGCLQIGLPDGSTILVNTSDTPVDMSTKNATWNPATTGNPYSITLTVKGAVTVNAPSVYLGGAQGSGTGVARIGDTVDLTTGVITSGSSVVFAE